MTLSLFDALLIERYYIIQFDENYHYDDSTILPHFIVIIFELFCLSQRLLFAKAKTNCIDREIMKILFFIIADRKLLL